MRRTWFHAKASLAVIVWDTQQVNHDYCCCTDENDITPETPRFLLKKDAAAQRLPPLVFFLTPALPCHHLPVPSSWCHVNALFYCGISIWELSAIRNTDHNLDFNIWKYLQAATSEDKGNTFAYFRERPDFQDALWIFITCLVTGILHFGDGGDKSSTQILHHHHKPAYIFLTR